MTQEEQIKGWQEGSDQNRGSLEEGFTLFLGLAGNCLLDFLAMSPRTTPHVSHYTRNFTFLILTLTATLQGSISLVSQMRKQSQRPFVLLLVKQLESDRNGIKTPVGLIPKHFP